MEISSQINLLMWKGGRETQEYKTCIEESYITLCNFEIFPDQTINEHGKSSIFISIKWFKIAMNTTNQIHNEIMEIISLF